MSLMTLNFQNNLSMNMYLINLIFNFILIIMISIMMMISYMMIYIFYNKFINKMLIENNMLEILWTIMPLILILIIAIPSMKILYLNNELKNNILTIKIMGNQWFWFYEYLNLNKKFNSYMMMKKNFNFNLLETDNSLVIPFNYSIQLIISSLDVIHSWAIPSMNIKMDAIPNQLNNQMIKINKPNLIFGQCSEICGINHSFMPIKIESINFNNFMKWLN